MSIDDVTPSEWNESSRRLKLKTDMVNHPPHYNQGGVECIEYIKQVLGHDGFLAYLRGNVVKYNHRLLLKGKAGEDAGKLAWYASRLAKEIEDGR